MLQQRFQRRRLAPQSRCPTRRLGSSRTHCPHSAPHQTLRSEEHTSELQSLAYLVCRLLLEKKKIKAETRKIALHSVDYVASVADCRRLDRGAPAKLALGPSRSSVRTCRNCCWSVPTLFVPH